MSNLRSRAAGIFIVSAVFAAGTFSFADPRPSVTSAPTTKPFRSVETEHLHNAHVVTDKVVSGAQPDDEESFKTLQALGIKTIISVDGARPDIETARKYGMSYVHLPIGYDGVDESEGLAIAKAINEKPGPIYLHCHHGKHRSAAAVAVACVYNGSLKPEQAESVLKTFGTGENYKGLWAAARGARPVDPAKLRELNVNFVEAAKITEMGEMMVQVDKHWDHMKAIQKAGWQSPKDHPDLDPPHEALQVEEHLRESARLQATADRPEEFRAMMVESEAGVAELRTALSAKPVDQIGAERAFKKVAASCVSCHKAYRD